MPSTPPRTPHHTQRSPQGRWGAVVAETREGPQSSLLFSAAAMWSSQDILGRRASDLGSARQSGRTGVPPSGSVHTIREKGHRRSASLPMNHWPSSSATSRGELQLQTALLSPQQHNSNPTPFSISSSAPPAYVNQAINNTYNTQITNTHLAPLPLPPAPPPLRRFAPIALPPLSHTPIQIHPLISYHQSPTGPDAPVHWNMSFPPSTARLAFALGGIPASRWSREVAVEPRTLPTITVRIAGVARPVVVFPAEIGHTIRIVDVLWAVYSALRLAALESIGGLAADVVDGRHWSCSGGSVAADDAAIANAIRRHFRRDIWWDGLYESPEEADVWVLELCGAKTRWY